MGTVCDLCFWSMWTADTNTDVPCGKEQFFWIISGDRSIQCNYGRNYAGRCLTLTCRNKFFTFQTHAAVYTRYRRSNNSSLRARYTISGNLSVVRRSWIVARILFPYSTIRLYQNLTIRWSVWVYKITVHRGTSACQAFLIFLNKNCQ